MPPDAAAATTARYRADDRDSCRCGEEPGLRTAADFLVDISATPNGCTRCGRLERGHDATHAYAAPPDVLRLARMRARREARLNPPPRPTAPPDTYVTLTADTSDFTDALRYAGDHARLFDEAAEVLAARMRGAAAQRLAQRGVLAIGTPEATGGIYDQYRQWANADTQAEGAANYLLAQYARGREHSTLTLTPQPQDERFPDRVRVGDGPWMPARVEMGPASAARIDRERLPFELALDFTLPAAQLAQVARALDRMGLTVSEPLIPAFSSAAGTVRSAVGRAELRLDPELEAAKHWPAQGSTCAHVCGPDPGHVCDARATTTLQHALPSGGMRDLPLCRPCHLAESVAEKR